MQVLRCVRAHNSRTMHIHDIQLLNDGVATLVARAANCVGMQGDGRFGLSILPNPPPSSIKSPSDIISSASKLEHLCGMQAIRCSLPLCPLISAQHSPTALLNLPPAAAKCATSDKEDGYDHDELNEPRLHLTIAITEAQRAISSIMVSREKRQVTKYKHLLCSLLCTSLTWRCCIKSVGGTGTTKL